MSQLPSTPITPPGPRRPLVFDTRALGRQPGTARSETRIVPAPADLRVALAGVPAGAEGVTFLPYLQGERTPYRDASLRAAFVGLSLAHSRAHMTRAVLEGVCFALRDCLAVLQEIDLAPTRLLLTGGGARSAFIRRLQADIFGLPVTTVNREEGPAYGAALLAGVGVGAFPDLKAAVQCTLLRAPLTDSDPAAHRDYQRIYERFRDCYAAGVPPRS